MAIHRLHRIQQLPISLEEAWDFISSPENLKIITPDYMGFDITTPDLPDKMYPGMIITYKVRPFFNIPVEWVTEITQVREPYFFVDEQRSGPYALWHHKHYLQEIEGGVEMQDIVHYKLPFSPLSEIMHPLTVEKKLTEIFDYRFNKFIELYGTMEQEEVVGTETQSQEG